MNLSIAVYILNECEEQEIPRRHLRDHCNVLEMPTKQFVGNFRVSKEIFVFLLGTLKDKWLHEFRSTQIRPVVKLGTFLRFLATGSYQQTVGNERLSLTSQSTVARIITECLRLFDEFVCREWIQMPSPEEERKIMEAFYEASGSPGVIGCVDGTHVRIKSPGEELKGLYYNRKAYYSTNAMMACDHKMRVIYVDARHPGANHDAIIWEYSQLNQRMQTAFDNGKRNTWMLGYGGYNLKPYIMTPFRSPRDAAERLYNKKHISVRNIIERCFGVLKNRFRCIIGSKGLHYEPAKVTQIINVCCALHNMCIQYRCSEEAVVSTSEDLEENFENADVEEDALEARAVAIRRRIAINL